LTVKQLYALKQVLIIPVESSSKVGGENGITPNTARGELPLDLQRVSNSRSAEEEANRQAHEQLNEDPIERELQRLREDTILKKKPGKTVEDQSTVEEATVETDELSDRQDDVSQIPSTGIFAGIGLLLSRIPLWSRGKGKSKQNAEVKRRSA
jgi:hypothetical protein